MPGTYVKDKNAAVLNDGTAITSATTTTGAAVQVDKPGFVQIENVVGTNVGSHTAEITIEAADDSGFTVNKVVVAKFGTTTSTTDNGTTKRLISRCDKKYARSVIVTAGTVTSSSHTIKLRPWPYQRTAATTTA